MISPASEIRKGAPDVFSSVKKLPGWVWTEVNAMWSEKGISDVFSLVNKSISKNAPADPQSESVND